MYPENNTSEEKTVSTNLRWPAAAAICVAVLLPLTAFAGIGGWTGVQKVMLGTAVELATPEANEAAAEPAGVQAEETRSERTASRGPAGFLGVSTTSLSDQLRAHFGVPEEAGVLVSNVSDDSAAYQAGLQAGDVITAVDGTSIENGSDLRRAIRRAGADNQVSIEIYRDGQPLELGAVLGTADSRRASFSYSNDDDWDGDGDQRFAWSDRDVDRFTDRMEAFGERMAEWGEKFGEDFGDRWATEFEQNGEEFGRRMEAWGEEFGRRMEERFENGDWENRFNFDGEWDTEAFEDAMENLNLELEGLDFEGLGVLIEEAMGAIDFDSLGQTITDAVEQAMEAMDNNGNRE